MFSLFRGQEVNGSERLTLSSAVHVTACSELARSSREQYAVLTRFFFLAKNKTIQKNLIALYHHGWLIFLHRWAWTQRAVLGGARTPSMSFHKLSQNEKKPLPSQSFCQPAKASVNFYVLRTAILREIKKSEIVKAEKYIFKRYTLVLQYWRTFDKMSGLLPKQKIQWYLGVRP